MSDFNLDYYNKDGTLNERGWEDYRKWWKEYRKRKKEVCNEIDTPKKARAEIRLIFRGCNNYNIESYELDYDALAFWAAIYKILGRCKCQE